MTIKELRIGNWVRVRDDYYEECGSYIVNPGDIVKVREIISSGINPDWSGAEVNDFVPMEALEPIPLTAEILLKNGFGDEDTSDDVYGDEIEVDITLEGWPRITEYCEIYHGFGKKIRYVHEFQNALSDIGEEVEIEL